METKTRLRQTALKASIKLAQYDRSANFYYDGAANSYSIILDADKFFNWLIKDEIELNIEEFRPSVEESDIPF